MPTARSTRSRPGTTTGSRALPKLLKDLKADHARVKKAYQEFKKLDVDENPDECEALVRQVLSELTVHATLEEEILYPAAREVLDEDDLLDEALVEHESAHALIDQLSSMGPEDDMYAARFTVLCEYVMHHVKEEEDEMFPKLAKADLDWEGLDSLMQARRADLTPSA